LHPNGPVHASIHQKATVGGKVILDFMEVFMDDILVPLAFFAMIAALVLVPDYFKSKDRARLHETLRIAYEKGQPVPPELIQALQSGNLATKDVNRSDKDLRAAVVLIGLSLGLVGMSFALGQLEGGEARYGLLAAAAIPGFIGLGFLVLWYFNRDRPKV
jgi:hypothetical protein